MADLDEARTLAALTRWGNAPVQIDTTVCDLHVIAGALHLALRHPHFPATSRAILERHLAHWADVLGHAEPLLGDLIRLGGDPAYDVPVEDDHG
jgi:hypothetical protein